MRLIIALFAALALTGCQRDVPDVYVDIDVNMPEEIEDTGVVETDDTDTDSDTGTAEPATLTVSYTNALSASGEFSVSRGQITDVNFGGFQFVASEPMWLEEFIVQMSVNQRPGELYSTYIPGHDGTTEANEHWSNCTLREWPSMTTFAGPIAA